MPVQTLPAGSTAFEKRLPTVSHKDGKAVFARAFAAEAFRLGAHEKRSTGPILTGAARRPFNNYGYGALSRACLAYVLSHAMPTWRKNHRSFGKLIKVIRDSAKTMADAADELASQMNLHDRETASRDRLRYPALVILSAALHDKFIGLVDEEAFIELITPKLIDQHLSDNEVTHRLSGLVGLYDEASRFLEDYNRNNYVIAQYNEPIVKARHQHRADHERIAFILALAAIYEKVLQQRPSARSGMGGQTAPFMRFVARVFQELGEQTLVPLPGKVLKSPSVATVRAMLKQRPATPSKRAI